MVRRNGDCAFGGRAWATTRLPLGYFAFSTHVPNAFLLEQLDSRSDFSTDVVPTSTGLSGSASF